MEEVTEVTTVEEPTQVMAFLSVEAWADCCDTDEDGNPVTSWSWNNWHALDEVEGVNSIEAALNFFIKEIGEQVSDELRFSVSDDGYNYVLEVIADDYRPIYAIEHKGE